MDGDLGFLRSTPPFSELPATLVDGLADAAEWVSYADGALVLEEGGVPSDALYVVAEGSIELLRDGEVLDVLERGESFGFPSLLSREEPAFDVRARGATSCVRIGRDAAEGVFGTSPGLRFLTRGLRERAALVERADPGNLQRTIEEVDSLAALVAVASTFPRAMASLRAGGTEALAVARATAGVVDAITRRALALGMATVGEPPAPWAWLAFGSVARREPGLAPDQDTTIVWDGDDAHDGYFGAVAQIVTETLERVGLDPCRSGVTATTPGWRGPIDRWTERLLAPTGRPSRSVFLLMLALDLRKVAGPLRVDETAKRLVGSARSGARFWRLARLAVEQRPPVGALGGLLTERTQDGRRTVDLKQGGLLAVTDMARLRAIQHGVVANGTVERLRDPAVAAAFGEDAARALEEAFATFAELRLDRQAAASERRAALDASVEPAALDPISRIRLRQSFRVVDHVQDGIRRELGVGRAM